MTENNKRQDISSIIATVKLETDIKNIYKDCCDDNWDGNMTARIVIKTRNNALNFIKCLPGNIILPEITPEPYGDIYFEWRKEHLFLSVWIYNNNMLRYNYLFKGERHSGNETFTDKIPIRIYNILKDEFSRKRG